MRLYNQPTLELLTLSPTDIIQNSPTDLLTGNDPYKQEPDGWEKTES
ncbi:MAG: hypothetical protein IKJ00_07390 [Clostridia bacterium]|nr:hypothetical protein [Clostridia bacterium]